MGRTRQLNWFLLFTTGYHFPPGMFVSMFTLGLWAAAFWYFAASHDIHMPATLHQLLAPIIGLLLVFRTNSAYERWWEARRQLGQLTNTARFLAMKFKAYAPDRCERAADLLASFCVSLRDHLGPGPDPSPTPLQLLDCLSQELVRLEVSAQELRTLEGGVMELCNVLGACERIRNTPIPHAYTFHSRRLVTVYVLSLPLGIADAFHYWTVPIVMVVFYIMAGIEFIGEEIEDPFGADENDLPVGQLVEGSANQVRLIVGLPPG